MTVLEFVKDSAESWEEFGYRCIIGAYGADNGEGVADKEVNVSPERTISNAKRLGEYLEERGQETISRLQTFDAMDELRKVKL